MYETPFGIAKKYSVVTPRGVELAFTALLSVRGSEASRARMKRREAEYDAIVCSVRFGGPTRALPRSDRPAGRDVEHVGQRESALAAATP